MHSPIILLLQINIDEAMASQSIFLENSSPISNMIIGLQFGAIIFNEKYSDNLGKFTSAGLSSNIFFGGALLFGKKEDKDSKHICLYGDHAREDKGLANQT
jgi:hypothetical protein